MSTHIFSHIYKLSLKITQDALVFRRKGNGVVGTQWQEFMNFYAYF